MRLVPFLKRSPVEVSATINFLETLFISFSTDELWRTFPFPPSFLQITPTPQPRIISEKNKNVWWFTIFPIQIERSFIEFHGEKCILMTILLNKNTSVRYLNIYFSHRTICT